MSIRIVKKNGALGYYHASTANTAPRAIASASETYGPVKAVMNANVLLKPSPAFSTAICQQEAVVVEQGISSPPDALARFEIESKRPGPPNLT
jgi:hypothetical protein